MGYSRAIPAWRTFAEFLDEFRAAGLHYQWTIVANRQVSSVQQRDRLINRWIPIVLCRKGRFKPTSVLNDVLEASEQDKSLHVWQQPVEEAKGLIIALSRPGSTICDLFAGTGSTAVATVQAGQSRTFIGCESDLKLVKAARSRVAQAMSARKTAEACG